MSKIKYLLFHILKIPQLSKHLDLGATRAFYAYIKSSFRSRSQQAARYTIVSEEMCDFLNKFCLLLFYRSYFLL